MLLHIINKHINYILLTFLCSFTSVIHGIGEVIYAVNCGGEMHTDINGVRYQKDPYPSGIASDYGKNLMIQRVAPQDQILYQTEKYDTRTFGVDIPVKQDGDYVLVLKFSEVWFTAANQKVFDVVLNSQHVVVDQLDIFSRVGRGVAHDELVPFSIKAGKLITADGESSSISAKLTVEFQKGDKDNPKINAFYVMRGTMSDVPQLPPLPGLDKPQVEEDDIEDEIDDELRSGSKKKRPSSGPKIQDPYMHDDTSSALLPVFIAVGAFIPLLFCLCKL